MKPSLSNQIAELRREQAMRANVYPGLISRGKLRRAEADYQNACLAEAIASLEWLLVNRERIQAALKAGVAA